MKNQYTGENFQYQEVLTHAHGQNLLNLTPYKALLQLIQEGVCTWIRINDVNNPAEL
jgi:hypothetical protein